MPINCSVFGCSNSNKTKDVSVHKFPSDEGARKKWCLSMKRKGFMPTSYSHVCSAHFKPTDFETVGRDGKPLKYKRLKKDAVNSDDEMAETLQLATNPKFPEMILSASLLRSSLVDIRKVMSLLCSLFMCYDRLCMLCFAYCEVLAY